ncbi:hypothetical protein Goklo_015898, partial [Gossypium klotzschianum]|nr:hypothetical protein [Gossypium klotzschianum]
KIVSTLIHSYHNSRSPSFSSQQSFSFLSVHQPLPLFLIFVHWPHLRIRVSSSLLVDRRPYQVCILKKP